MAKRDGAHADAALVPVPQVADEPVRATRLYGAIEIPDELGPQTKPDSGVYEAASGPTVGDRLAHYEVEDVLGRGGMGEVLSARDHAIGRAVAIKRLRIASPSGDVLARFLREVRIQGRLEHPAVVPVHELAYDENDQPFFVTKQLAGTTLADVLPRLARGERAAEETFSRQRLLRAFVDVCLAIEFGHTRGVVHRDLKPANFVLGDFGEVYVLDWGIAHVGDEASPDAGFADVDTVGGADTLQGTILGTPGYIAPEQINADPSLDRRADVYSLGCILFELLTLEPLHPRGHGAIASAFAGVDAHASMRAPDREIPPELDAICVRATALDRDHRFATARQLATEVQRFLDGKRDLNLRAELARSALHEAQRAFVVDSPDERRVAIRSAARALALDPTNREAADVVGRLMLEPPRETPAEVEAELARLDEVSLRQSAKFGTIAAVVYALFFPLMYWAGFRELWYHLFGITTCVLIVIAQAVLAPRTTALWPRYFAMFANLGMFALFSYLASPVVFGPGPPIVMVMLLVSHRRLIPVWMMALLTSSAVLLPFLLEALGVLGPQLSIENGSLRVHTLAGSLDPTVTIIALVFYTFALGLFAGLLGQMQNAARRDATRAMALQAWQVRQLVPRARTVPPPS
ncbi:MAG TPA: serine/threonine-protein kinase [Kofleriaceae bacterium]|nr:serine/threonine-protein kinase [Kofleriaceae bacterium]